LSELPARRWQFEERGIPVDDITLATWIVAPEADRAPCVVLAHGWAAVKEMSLDYVAAALADAGIASVVFDHRGTGASTGPAGDLDPERQIEDYRAVLTAAASLPFVDPGRLGIWGTSYSGGHVFEVAARDSRVRATVSQVPTISGSENTRRRVAASGQAFTAEDFEREHARLAAGSGPQYMPAVRAVALSADRGGRPAAVSPPELPIAPPRVWGNDLAGFYGNYPPERLQTWRNAVTLSSQERYETYEPGLAISAAADRPLLVIVGSEDIITPSDLAIGAYETVRSTGAKLVQFEGGHYDAYGVHLDLCARSAAQFFTEALN
jgi:pimeloyl-ACP methyl ester carboxylesterase